MSTYNSPLLYGSGDKLMGESSYVKSWLDAQNTVVDLKLLIHGQFYKTSTAGNHFFSVLENASLGGSTFLILACLV